MDKFVKSDPRWVQVEVPFFRTPYNYDRDAATKETALVCVGKSLTLQSQAADADINVIVRRCVEQGTPLPQIAMPPTFGDFDRGDLDYGAALRLIRAADASFMQLPAAFRARLDNDPARFVDFCQAPENLEELRRLGLAVPQVPENPGVPTAPAVVPESAPASPAPAPAKAAATAA